MTCHSPPSGSSSCSMSHSHIARGEQTRETPPLHSVANLVEIPGHRSLSSRTRTHRFFSSRWPRPDEHPSGTLSIALLPLSLGHSLFCTLSFLLAKCPRVRRDVFFLPIDASPTCCISSSCAGGTRTSISSAEEMRSVRC